MKKIILILLVGIIAISCDVIDGPYKQTQTTAGEFKKKVVIVDFTAIHCVFCPTANKVANDLATLYDKKKVIVIGAHASTLAVPNPNVPAELNMISETSKELYDKFAPGAGLPKGMVNQLDVDGQKITNFGQWDELVIQESYVEPEMDMSMELEYNETDSTVKVIVKTDFLVNSSADDNLAIYVTEDSLISPQKTPGGAVIEDYVHNHVLRASITGTLGVQLSSTVINKGSSISKEYTYKIPNGFRHNQLGFVAFIQDKNTHVLKQAISEHLHE